MDALFGTAIPFAVFAAVITVVILISSAARRTAPRAGFIALIEAVGIWIVAAVVSSLVGPSASSGSLFLTGLVLTVVLAQRTAYQWGASWLLFLLGPIGWFLIMWRANNQADARRGTASVA